MDPLSIAAGCAGLISTIGTLSLSIHGFVRTCREARKDLDKVSRELQSLQSVLRLIEDDATNEEKPFPPVIGQHVLSIVSNCNSVILEIEACIAQYGQKRLKAQVTWAIGGQGDVEKLRTNLEAHKSSLELALDMHSLAITKDIKADTAEIRHDTTSIRENTEQILQEIVRLQAQLSKDVTTPNDYVLQRFLEEMTTYTEMALDITIVGSDDDSIQAFYDIEEVSEASADQKRSDDSLATSDEPQPPNVSEAERASEPPAKTNPSGKLTSSPEPPSQQPAASRKAVKHFSRRWNKRSLLKADHAEFPASHGPSKNEATSAQQRASAVKEASASKDSDTGARGKKVQGRGVTLRPSEAPMPKSSDDDPGTSKEPQPARLSNDEAPALDFIPGSKVVASESTDASNTENKKSKRRTTALNEPTIDSSGNAHVKLFDGNLAVDFRYLNPLANKGHLFSVMAEKRGNEWGTWRYMAVTCPARQLTAERYLLRPMISSRLRTIRTILFFRLTPGESPAQFAKRWSIILMELHRLPCSQRSSVVIHVFGPPGWRGLDKNISTALQEMCINRAPESPIASLDGRDLSHCYSERDRNVLGKRVHCIVRETFTNMYPQKAMFRSSKLHMKADTIAVRVISTAPMTNEDTYQDWVTAIGQQLQPKVVIDMTKISEFHHGVSMWTQGAQLDDDDALPHTKDTWGIGLRFVLFHDLIVYLRRRGYGDKK